MNQLKVVLRLVAQGLNHRHIAASYAVGQASGSDQLLRARAPGHRDENIPGWRDKDCLPPLVAPPHANTPFGIGTRNVPFP